MRRLWIRMTEIFGHRWTSAMGEDAATGSGETWARGLSGLSAEQIRAGIERTIVAAEPWPPTLPEFRSMCLGIPSLAQVQHNLRDRDSVRAPFSALVWSKLDGFAYGLASAEKAERMLRDAYRLASDHVMAGGALPEARPAVGHDTYRPTPPVEKTEHARAQMAEISRLLGLGGRHA